MKKISILLLAAATVLMASCKDEIQDTSKRQGTGGEATLTISTSIPNEAIGTYGTGEGGVTNLDYSDYDLRYTLEVYNLTTKERVYRDVKIANEFTGSVAFNTKLPEDSYIAYVWADFLLEGSTADLYYNASDLTQVKLLAPSAILPYTINENARDAYYGSSATREEIIAGQSNTLDLTLRRPFGKIRFIATDVKNGNPTSPATVKVNYTTQVPATFDVTGLSGRQTEYVSLGEYAATPEQESDILINGRGYEPAFDGGEYYVLAYDYIFPDKAKPTVPVIVTTYDAGGEQLGNRGISAVPIAENRLTTVIGDFYTGDAPLEIVVSVSDRFNYADLPVIDILPRLIPAAGATYTFASVENHPDIELVDDDGSAPGWLHVTPDEVFGSSATPATYGPRGEPLYTMINVEVDENDAGTRSCTLTVGKKDPTSSTGWDMTKTFVRRITQEAAPLAEAGIYNVIVFPFSNKPSLRPAEISYTSPLLSWSGGLKDSTTHAPKSEIDSSFSLGKTVNLKFTTEESPASIKIEISNVATPYTLLKSNPDTINYENEEVWVWNVEGSQSSATGYYVPNQESLTGGDYYLSIAIGEAYLDTKFRVTIRVEYANDGR